MAKFYKAENVSTAPYYPSLYVSFGLIFVCKRLLTFRPLKYSESITNITNGATFFIRQSILHGI